MPSASTPHDWRLVAALTRLAFANQQAIEQAPNPRVAAILAETGRVADEAARHVQFDRLDQLTERQRQLVEQCKKDL